MANSSLDGSRLFDKVDGLNDQQGGSHEPSGDPSPATDRVVAGNYSKSASAHSSDASSGTGSGESINHDAAMVLWTKLLTVFTAVLAVVAFGTLAITAFQLNAMLKQLNQMKVGNEQVKHSVEQASRQAAAAEASNLIAREAVSNANRSFITETITTSEPLQTGSDFHINVGMRAIGNTPAIEVQDHFQVSVGDPSREVDLTDNDVSGTAEVIMFPGVSHGETIAIPASQLQQEAIDTITSEKRYIYVHGLILYKDFSGATHFVRACQRYIPESGSFKACSRRRSNLAN